MTEIHYGPPESGYRDTLLAFKVFARPSVSARIDPDPLGDINCIIRLLHNGRPVRGVLHPILKPGTKIRIVRDEATVSIREMFEAVDQVWSIRGGGGTPFEITAIQPPGWRIEVDDKTVLQVLDSELYPPAPIPKTPWRRRARRAINARARAVADALAMRLGYHRDGECEG